MRGLAVLAAFIMLATVLLMARAASPADDTVAITRLINHMKQYDGRTVTIRGEAIGDVMVRGTDAWITVNDDEYSRNSIEEGGELVGMSNAGIGIWLSSTDAEKIRICGGYKNKGDIVAVTGTFNRACKEHGGDTDIHATSLEVVKEGYPFERSFPWGKLIALLALVGMAGGLWWYRWYVKKAGLREAHREY
ncbi:MAG: hypothetical protein KKE36_16125 [Actinobacteria bacterium]|nr:hypothetical protein [Actinomycetota bacterium]